jgi:hypothetical protein
MLNKLSICPTSGRRSDIRDILKPTSGYSSDDNISIDVRRQRRRVGDDDYSFQQRNTPPSTSSPVPAVPKNSTRVFAGQETYLADIADTSSPLRNWTSNVISGTEDELAGAIGQLSLNEDEQVRYHGKASGLYLLDNKERVDRRNEGGIWFGLPSLSVCMFLTSLFKALPESSRLASAALRFDDHE